MLTVVGSAVNDSADKGGIPLIAASQEQCSRLSSCHLLALAVAEQSNVIQGISLPRPGDQGLDPGCRYVDRIRLVFPYVEELS